MIRKAVGIILVIVALVITVLLFTGGGPVVPHIVGPITLTVVGVFLFTRNTNIAPSDK